MIQNIRIVLFFINKTEEMDFFSHGGRFHENIILYVYQQAMEIYLN